MPGHELGEGAEGLPPRRLRECFPVATQKDPRVLQRGGVGPLSVDMVELLEWPPGLAEANRRVSEGRSVRLPGSRAKVDSWGDGGYCDWFFFKGLHTVTGPRRISRFIESLVRPHVIAEDLEAGDCQMAQDVSLRSLRR